MIEVYKTNVTDQEHANILLDLIHKTFIDYNANFDLEDCDRILRVKCTKGVIHSPSVIDLLIRYGYCAEILQDNNASQEALISKMLSEVIS
ncbi:MAG: hypothetical protein H0X33_06495 [Taibaiella sp.]|nr:hypothetical protein [Taibaiella sp.]